MRCRKLIVLVLVIGAVGCAHRAPVATTAPTIALSIQQADRILESMTKDRKRLDRPVVILNGYLDPGLGGAAVSSIIREHVEDSRIITVNFLFCSTFDECRRQVIRAVDEAYPSSDPSQTSQVDVIGLSMGGLVGRYAAAPVEGKRRLNVARLFTVSSPHQGALRAAALPDLTQLQADMKPGSKFLTELAAKDRLVHYEIYPYSRTSDTVVGAQYAAPPGMKAVVVSNPPFQPAHVGAATDPRIMADILRRLRHETPLLGDG